jgi:hypothetical protein
LLVGVQPSFHQSPFPLSIPLFIGLSGHVIMMAVNSDTSIEIIFQES